MRHYVWATALGLAVGSADAATFQVEFWDIPLVPRERVADLNPLNPPADPFDFETEILGVAETVDPTLTFEVSALDFPNNSFPPDPDTASTVGPPQDPTTGFFTETLTLDQFIGSALVDDQGNDLSTQFVAGSIFRIRGTVAVSAGDNVFGIESDDGFLLTLDGQVQSGSETEPRGLSKTEITYTSATDELIVFDLLYYDAVQTQAGLFVTLDDELLAPSPIPLPATGFLLFGGLLGMGVLARRRSA